MSISSSEGRSVTLLRLVSGASGAARTLPPDLLDRAVKRLARVALVYAFVFLMSDLAIALLDAWFSSLAAQFNSLDDWLPATASIAMAVIVFGLCTWSTLPPHRLMTVGLGFEVLGSYGIAFAEYWGVYEGLPYEPAHLEIGGLSWVAVWMVFFTVVVPTSPRRALYAALASCTSVPVVFALTMRFGGTSIELLTLQFFFNLVFPYLLVTLMAYVGAHVVYRLGADVRKARELGSYRLVERLGQGGMGEVWRARHRLLARPAAIKMVRSEVLRSTEDSTGEVAIRRFEHEAQATAAMRSPNTIELYDFGVSDEGTFYYVMELLDGFDLETLVERFGPVPAGRAISLLRQVCHSLAEAHDAGLIHRDIKPANIYVCRYGRDVDFVKVLDFGLVTSHEDIGGSTPRLTADNIVGGTPAFMAPEQVLGGTPVDGRSDLYAVGCVGYWLVTGQLVFEGETAMRTMVMHTQDPPAPPSRRTELAIPAEFERIILRCLEKNPNDRPQTADELATSLAACGSGEPWTAERAQEWWSRNRPS